MSRALIAAACGAALVLVACGSSGVGGPPGGAGAGSSGNGPSGSGDAVAPGSGAAPEAGASEGAAPLPAPATTRDGGDEAGAAAGGSAGRKRGIAYGSLSEGDMTALSPGIGWWYNWSPQPDSTLPANYAPAGVEFVPMIWGGTFDPTELAKQVPAGAKYLLTFNEPNFGAQSNLTPQQAAALWPKVEAFATSRGLQIVSPALNYCGGSCNETNPFTWLDDFFAACTGCRVDYVAMHWYACSKGALTGYLSEYETKYEKPLWLTEFSCLDGSLAATAANEGAYMKDALAALEADPMVFRYSWFTGRFTGQPAIDLLGAASGALTPLGQEYVAFPAAP
jgi:hypothetical protein